MEPEPFIFMQERCLDQHRRNGRERQPETVFIVPGERQAKKLAVIVINSLGKTDAVPERRREKAEKDEDDEYGNCYTGKAFQGFFKSFCHKKHDPVIVLKASERSVMRITPASVHFA